MGITHAWGDSFPWSIRQNCTYAPWPPLPFTALNCSTLLLLWGLNPNSSCWLKSLTHGCIQVKSHSLDNPAGTWFPKVWVARDLGRSRQLELRGHIQPRSGWLLRRPGGGCLRHSAACQESSASYQVRLLFAVLKPTVATQDKLTSTAGEKQFSVQDD